MMRGVSWLRGMALIGAAIAAASPLSGIAAAQESALEISRIDVDSFPEVGFDVAVPASLTVGGVDPQGVTIFENGQPIPAEVALVPTDGLEVVLLIDTSGSMNERAALASAKSGAVGFLEELPAAVAVGVVEPLRAASLERSKW